MHYSPDIPIKELSLFLCLLIVGKRSSNPFTPALTEKGEKGGVQTNPPTTHRHTQASLFLMVPVRPMGVAWFLREPAAPAAAPVAAAAEPSSDETSSSSGPGGGSSGSPSRRRHDGSRAVLALGRGTPRRRRPRPRWSPDGPAAAFAVAAASPAAKVDVIDIEDEDHSFTSFFVGVGPSAGIRRQQKERRKSDVRSVVRFLRVDRSWPFFYIKSTSLPARCYVSIPSFLNLS